MTITPILNIAIETKKYSRTVTNRTQVKILQLLCCKFHSYIQIRLINVGLGLRMLLRDVGYAQQVFNTGMV